MQLTVQSKSQLFERYKTVTDPQTNALFRNFYFWF